MSGVDMWGVPKGLPVLLRRAELNGDHSRLERILGRKPTITEASATESMESEHASYGSSRDILKRVLPIRGFNHIKSIGDEAAAVVIGFDRNGNTITAVYSSESHNHPSFVCAHPGSATGTGGCERDNIALTGSKPHLLSEARRQAHPLHNNHDDPIQQHTIETTSGIADYGNAMGIPHQDGSIKFDTRYAGNNLVNVMTITFSPSSRLLHNQVPQTDAAEKYVGIYVGKASDTTGIGGTKFASVSIDMTNTDLNEKAVQDPDPHLQEAITRGIERVIEVAIEEGWKDNISLKDMGAAGLLCSTIEQLPEGYGVDLFGDLVPKNALRTSLELLEAETQERFFFYAHEDVAQRIVSIFNEEIGLGHVNKGAAAAVIGRCNSTGIYRFINQGIVDVDVPVADLREGPLHLKPYKERLYTPQKIPESTATLQEKVLAVLTSINFKSDAYVHGHYDKNVQSLARVRRGEGAATLHTHGSLNNEVGISCSFDSNPVYGLISPKQQAEDSFLRGAWKMAAVGCSVIGVTNNANYGKTDVPEEMWEFKEGQEGVARACYNWELEKEYIATVCRDPDIAERHEEDKRTHLTVNSGNCSLNKANANTGTAIPPTTIAGLVGWTNKPDMYATWDLKDEPSELYLVGARQDALGGTDLLQALYGPSMLGDKLFDIDYASLRNEVNGIIQAVRSGLVSAANLIEEGGLVNAVAEMLANSEEGFGAKLEYFDDAVSKDGQLFSQSYGMVLQISSANKERFLEHMQDNGITAFAIGEVTKDSQLTIDGKTCLSQERTKELYHNKIDHMLANSR